MVCLFMAKWKRNMALMYYNEQAQSSWLPIEMTNPSLLLSTFSGVFLLLLYRIGNYTTVLSLFSRGIGRV